VLGLGVMIAGAKGIDVLVRERKNTKPIIGGGYYEKILCKRIGKCVEKSEMQKGLWVVGRAKTRLHVKAGTKKSAVGIGSAWKGKVSKSVCYAAPLKEEGESRTP